MGGEWLCWPPGSGGVSRGAYHGQQRKTPESTQLHCLPSEGREHTLLLLCFELLMFVPFRGMAVGELCVVFDSV